MANPQSPGQIPAAQTAAPPVDEMAEALQQGIELGKVWAQEASLKLKVWAEENPGQFVLAGVAAGFVLGKLLFAGPRRRTLLDEDD